MTTWPQTAASQTAGDAAAGLALLKQAEALAGTLSGTANTHQTVPLAAHLGAATAGTCLLDEANEPLAALVRSASGMVAGPAWTTPWPMGRTSRPRGATTGCTI